MRRIRWCSSIPFAAVVFVAMGLGSSVGYAQDTRAGQQAIAEALFREGRDLMRDGRTREACRKFEESLRLDRVLGTLLNSAVCHEEEGKIATAWAEFTEAAERAAKEGQADRVSFASDKAAALAPRLPRLAIMVPADNAVPEMAVTRNGTPLGSGAWNTALPVDPGNVEIEVTAPDHEPWKGVVRINEQEARTIEVPKLRAKPKPPPKPVVTPEPVAPPPPPPPPEFWTTTRTVGVIVTGTGAAVLTIGGLFGLDAISKRSDSDAYCSGDVCTDQRGVTLNDDAKQSANIANIATGVGAALTVTGVALLVFGGESEADVSGSTADTARRSSVRFGLVPSAKGATAGVSGTW